MIHAKIAQLQNLRVGLVYSAPRYPAHARQARATNIFRNCPPLHSGEQRLFG